MGKSCLMGLFTKVTNSVQIVQKALFSIWHQYFAQVGIMHLTLQYPVVDINITEKYNYVEEEEHISVGRH